MNYPIATTSEQSKRLLKCNVEPETADMVCEGNKILGLTFGRSIPNDKWENVKKVKIMPSWSLSRLLQMLPLLLEEYYRLVMGPVGNAWVIEYNDINITDCILKSVAADPVECAVQTIEWLTAEGYKLNEIKKK